MKKIAIIYHSVQGHTGHIASRVAEGALGIAKTEVHLLEAQQHAGVPYDEAANRLGSWSGLMAQAEKSSAAHAFAPGDIKTARMFGRNFAETLHRLRSDERSTRELEVAR